jgi:hypothetical protein
MAKQIIIPRDRLPTLNAVSQKYSVRYRLTNENRNRFSYWSTIFSVNPGFTYNTLGDILIEKHTGYSTIVWNPVSIEKDGQSIGELQEYDLWLRWGTSAASGDWEYKERTSVTSINVLKPNSSFNPLSVEIYPAAQPILRKATYDVDQSNSAGKVNLTNNTVTISSNNVLRTGREVLYESTDAIGGLTSGLSYYVRMITASTFTLHPTSQDAINNTNIINLTSHKNSIGFFTWQDCTVCNIFLYGKYNFSPV